MLRHEVNREVYKIYKYRVKSNEFSNDTKKRRLYQLKEEEHIHNLMRGGYNKSSIEDIIKQVGGGEDNIPQTPTTQVPVDKSKDVDVNLPKLISAQTVHDSETAGKLNDINYEKNKNEETVKRLNERNDWLNIKVSSIDEMVAKLTELDASYKNNS